MSHESTVVYSYYWLVVAAQMDSILPLDHLIVLGTAYYHVCETFSVPVLLCTSMRVAIWIPACRSTWMTAVTFYLSEVLTLWPALTACNKTIILVWTHFFDSTTRTEMWSFLTLFFAITQVLLPFGSTNIPGPYPQDTRGETIYFCHASNFWICLKYIETGEGAAILELVLT